MKSEFKTAWNPWLLPSRFVPSWFLSFFKQVLILPGTGGSGYNRTKPNFSMQMHGWFDMVGFAALKENTWLCPAMKNTEKSVSMTIWQIHMPETHLYKHHLIENHLSKHHLIENHLYKHHLTENHISKHHLIEKQISKHHLVENHISKHHLTEKQISKHPLISNHLYLDKNNLTENHLSNNY